MIGSGSENVSNLKLRAAVRSVWHAKFTLESLDYNVGVVKVATPFVVSAVEKPIALLRAGEEVAVGEPVVVSGWGLNEVSA